MACKLATEQIEKDPVDAAGVLTDAADAIVGIGAEIRNSKRDEPVTVSGRTLVYSHSVITPPMERLTGGLWECPCGEPHRRLISDRDAVVAGLTQPWNSGRVEGHVNRIRLINRQMYGRANLDLLRKRVLATP